MDKKIIILLFLILSPFARAFAQEEDVTVTVSMSKWKSMEDKISVLRDSITELRGIVVSKDNSISSKDSVYKDVFSKLQKANQSITDLQLTVSRMKTDSIKQEKSMGDIRSKLLAANSQLSKVDTMTIQMIITYMNLDRRCSDKRINTLRGEFQGISNTEIKTQYKQWDTLLSLYSQTYTSVRDAIIEGAGKIPNASMPPLRDRYISETEQKILALQYVKLFFDNKECSSQYLNTMITDARKLLSPTSSEKDFQDFIKSHP